MQKEKIEAIEQENKELKEANIKLNSIQKVQVKSRSVPLEIDKDDDDQQLSKDVMNDIHKDEPEKGKIKDDLCHLKSQNDELKAELVKMKKDEEKIKVQNLSISNFNSLPLSLQYLVSNYILKSLDNAAKQHISRLQNLIVYLIQFDDLAKTGIEIDSEESDFLTDINEKTFIRIPSEATEFLFKSNLLDSTDFIEILRHFSEISLELKYPSDTFQAIYDHLLNKYKISVLICGINETDEKFYCDENISFVRFDSSVRSIEGSNDGVCCEGSFEGCCSHVKRREQESLQRIY